MAGRSNTTLKKRLKEMARVEKQREKFAKRLEKKKDTPGENTDEEALEELPVTEAPAPETESGLSW
jgi:hypothetical protein